MFVSTCTDNMCATSWVEVRGQPSASLFLLWDRLFVVLIHAYLTFRFPVIFINFHLRVGAAGL